MKAYSFLLSWTRVYILWFVMSDETPMTISRVRTSWKDDVNADNKITDLRSVKQSLREKYKRYLK